MSRAGTQVDREAEISALGRALAVERRAKYIDFRGKRSTFSEFMRRTSDRLIKRFPQDLRWTTIRGLFRQYPNLDVASRMAIVRRTEDLLFGSRPVPTSEEPAQSPSQRYKSERPQLQREPEAFVPEPSSLYSKKTSTRSQSQQSITKASSRPGAIASSGPPGIAGVPPASFVNPAKNPKNPAAENNDPKSSVQSSAKSFEKDPRKVDVKFVRGVGPKIADLLGRLEIRTAEDLLRHYPREHLDFQNHLKIRDVTPGEDATILGTIRSVGAFQSKKGNVSILTISIHDGSGSIAVAKFVGGKSNSYLMERYKSSYPKGAQVIASGRVERDGYSGRLQLKNAEIEVLGTGASHDDDSEPDSLHTGRLVPVYPLTDGLSLKYIRNVIHNALEAYVDRIEDPLPAYLKERHNLPSLKTALWGIHFPESVEQKEDARRRLVFDELLMAQLQLAIRRHRFQSSNEALSLPITEGELLQNFKLQLPFKLTGAQERVFGEIRRDLASPKPMHRLVQGDVGSGKTVVAAMSALVAIENGYQVAVMAPTEILAEQHYRQFQRWLTPLGIRCALLLGKQGVKERKLIQQDLSSGQIHVAIGTHALIQDEVEFQKLGFVIIDEQHRFGVKQRARLKAKGTNPELLTMTATPIPRTLALTLHGDLDVSEIDELPPGRKPIETKLIGGGEKRQLHQFIREQIAFGRQAYIVFPLIEESETLSAKAATIEFEKLRNAIFPEISIGLMHGKLKPQEKDEVMEAFRAGEYKILVSTTVIEVGVDVPNATVMVIENADRFGLAQLHQLRGRVGRGGEKSYCFLVADSRSEQTRQRLGIMTQTNDGFVIAEKDLELRGPGEFLGVRQSGMPDLALANIVDDAKILELARNVALEIIKEDPELQNYPLLKEFLALKRVSETSDLISSG
jgi:ATP-dependent DNA helicase RecG